VDGVTKERLWAVLQKHPNDIGIITFNSGRYKIALNRHQLLCWQFLYEAPMIKTVIKDEGEGLAIWFADRPEPLLFEVESDSETLVIDNDSENTNLQTFFEFLEIDPELKKDSQFDRVSFMDIDGERFFCRMSDISMIRVPHVGHLHDPSAARGCDARAERLGNDRVRSLGLGSRGRAESNGVRRRSK
jgi:hypothetical protein